MSKKIKKTKNPKSPKKSRRAIKTVKNENWLSRVKKGEDVLIEIEDDDLVIVPNPIEREIKKAGLFNMAKVSNLKKKVEGPKTRSQKRFINSKIAKAPKPRVARPKKERKSSSKSKPEKEKSQPKKKNDKFETFSECK